MYGLTNNFIHPENAAGFTTFLQKMFVVVPVMKDNNEITKEQKENDT